MWAQGLSGTRHAEGVRGAQRAGAARTTVRLLGVFLLAAGGARMPDADACAAGAGAPGPAPLVPPRPSHKRAAEPAALASEAAPPCKRAHVGGSDPPAAGGAGARSANAFNDQPAGSTFDERMHPRNRYAGRRPDFAALAAQFPDFAALTTEVRACRGAAGPDALVDRSSACAGSSSHTVCPDAGTRAVLCSQDSRGRVHVDWKDPAASIALTRALLRADYGLEWDLPRYARARAGSFCGTRGHCTMSSTPLPFTLFLASRMCSLSFSASLPPPRFPSLAPLFPFLCRVLSLTLALALFVPRPAPTCRGFLCPPVPQRANYVHWIEDLLAGSSARVLF